VEAASAAAYSAATVEVAFWPASDWAAAYFTSAEAGASTPTGASAESWTAEARVSVEAAAVAVEPGAGADEDAAGEPAWSVEAVGCAGVRVIIVVAVRANWRAG